MPFFVPPRSRFRPYGGAPHYLSIARDVLTGRSRSGDAVAALEARLSAFLGVSHCICQPQARVGIYLTLKTLISPGQTVVLSPYTIYDVVNMVICAGGRPVFADIDRDTCNISVSEIEALTDENTGAILVTHLHGLACDIRGAAEIARRRNVPLVEDASQAFGTVVDGQRVGTFGRAGVFSFGMAKNVNSFYGGLVATEDTGLQGRLRDELGTFRYMDPEVLWKRVAICGTGDLLTARPIFDALTFWVYRYGHLHGIDSITNRWRGEDEPVLSRTIPARALRRMTPMQARLILRVLDDVDRDSSERIANARRYHEGLEDVPDIRRPPLREDGSHIYLTYPIQVPERERLLRFLIEQGRDLTMQHIGNCADYEVFAEYHRECPNARETSRQVLLLPTYPGYGAREVDRTVRAIRRYFGASTR
jgi:dTDP-4-amino-4,6-dideoxygalactose transaminase